MAIKSLMVNLEAGRSNESLLTLVANLAERLGASVIGICTCQLLQGIYSDGYVSSELVDGAQRAAQDDMHKAEAEFRALMGKRGCSIDWRSCIAIEGPAAYVACQARCADLIITGVTPSTGLGVKIGDLMMESGRPVVSIPAGVSKLTFEHAIVAWKDTREARRATAAALPLLKIASRVSVLEMADPSDLDSARHHVRDVAHWLARHGIHAEPNAVAAACDEPRAFADMAKTQGADLIVAGAYGHSRLREWVLGGFTRHLLNETGICALVVH
jgi:nucleotide-binding universal stress UspA family protein